MAQQFWKLVPKLKSKHVEDHVRFLAEREAVQADRKSISLGTKLKAMLVGKPAGNHKKKLELLDRQIAACFAKPGADLKPPLIGIDAKATKWYRKYLAEDPDVWPLPPDAMVEEMKGSPVWHLTKHRVLHDLGTDWPEGAFPVPTGAGVSLELMHSVCRDLAPKDADAAAGEIQDALFGYLAGLYPGLTGAAPQAIVKAVIDGVEPGAGPGSIPEQVQKDALAALSTITWLRFWAEQGYSFEHGESGG